MVTQKNPSTRPTIPTIRPILVISFVSTRPVEAAIAFGGVEIGRHIATEAQTATNTERPAWPPNAMNASEFEDSMRPLPIAIMIGMRRAAVAELLMKLERR